MKVFEVFLVYALLMEIYRAIRLDFNSSDCTIYKEKFGAANNSDRLGVSKISFSGDAAFEGNSSNVKVNIRYSDFDYFRNTTYWGLTQEDGKTPETTCLDMKLYKFNSNDYQYGVQTTNLTITPFNDSQKQWRYYSFTIKENDLATRLIQTQNSNNYIYKGYYGIAFYAADTDYLVYTFYFDFAVTVSKSTGAAVDTAFKPLSQIASAGCTPGGSCNITASSQLFWCKDFTCSQFQTPELHLNDQIVLLQKIVTEGMSNFYLTETEVWFTGNGLHKKATIIQIDNKTKGQVKLQLRVEIAWRFVTIQVNSALSNSQARRFLQQSTFDTVLAQTDVIECIKAQGEQTCPTCEQECLANGYSEDVCQPCLDATSVLLNLLYYHFQWVFSYESLMKFIIIF